MQETIAAAAIMKDGITYKGKRHWNIIKDQPHGFFKNCEQGFVTSHGRFVNRTEAAQIAYHSGQIKKEKRKLFSEDLW
jgi:hypothetical protein